MTKKKDDQLPPVDRFPLAWPAGKARTPADKRKVGQFKNTDGRGRITVERAVRRVSDELERLGGTDPVLSTNMQPAGLMGNLSETRLLGDDPGAAVYFQHGGKPIVFACDTYDRVADNIAAIGNHIDAIRAIERHGVGRLEQVLVGFRRQLTGRRAWFDVLQVKSDASVEAIEANYTRLAKDYHPDRPTGSHEKMTELNAAYEQAKKERLT